MFKKVFENKNNSKPNIDNLLKSWKQEIAALQSIYQKMKNGQTTKTDKMKKPQFFKLYGFPNMDNLETCKLDELKSWIKSKYDI